MWANVVFEKTSVYDVEQWFFFARQGDPSGNSQQTVPISMGGGGTHVCSMALNIAGMSSSERLIPVEFLIPAALCWVIRNKVLEWAYKEKHQVLGMAATSFGGCFRQFFKF